MVADVAALEKTSPPVPHEPVPAVGLGREGFGGQTRSVSLAIDGNRLEVTDDRYSDRIRCDHPELEDGVALGRGVKAAAQMLRRSRVVVFAREDLQPGLEKTGFVHEATMPGFYNGEVDCAVMGMCTNAEREGPAFPREDAKVEALLDDSDLRDPPDDVVTRRATPDDAEELARLLGQTFAQYPTPSDDPSYVLHQLKGGTPFRVVEEEGEVVACASADLVAEAQTAELTDCATRPDMRGRSFMQKILCDLMDDLRDLGYPTAFTLARARIPGVNLAFSRLGFELRGRMNQSCRIGDGLEDMNVLSRSL